jgi:V8-like Glu-specific endopeptidase
MDNNHITAVDDVVVRYTTPNAPGSSGSPVINAELDVIAVYNRRNGQGVRISAILNDVRYNATHLYHEIKQASIHEI